LIATDLSSRSPVLLVVPPFQGLKHPALGPSQLKANLEREGIPCEVLYLNLLFAERITPYVHEWLSGTGPALVGEFVFSNVLHDLSDEAVQRFVDDIVTGSDFEPLMRSWFPGKTPVEVIRSLSDEARDFLEGEAMDEIAARDPWMVGCSSTFQANCCSLALIRQLKRVRPKVVTVMGGANCETVMGEELMRV
jgi:magnesium-protoporphyrin IX monomethyl ester (oxidative) cyclase